MERLRKIYERVETSKETLLAEEITNEHENQAEIILGQHEIIKIFNEFKKQYNALQQDVFPNVFKSAIKAAGSVGKMLSQSEIMKMPEAEGKVFFNACQIFVRKQTLLITVCGNPETYRLEVGVKWGENTPLKKDYDIKRFSEDILEEQIIECLKHLSAK